MLLSRLVWLASLAVPALAVRTLTQQTSEAAVLTGQDFLNGLRASATGQDVSFQLSAASGIINTTGALIQNETVPDMTAGKTNTVCMCMVHTAHVCQHAWRAWPAADSASM